MRLNETRIIDRPIGEVFAYTADFANSEEWDPGVKSAARADSGELGVGSKFDLIFEFGGKRMPMVYEITDYEPEKSVVLRGEGETFGAVDEIVFKEVSEDSTRVEYIADLRFDNFLKYLGPLLGPFMKPMGRRALDGLKTALES